MASHAHPASRSSVLTSSAIVPQSMDRYTHWHAAHPSRAPAPALAPPPHQLCHRLAVNGDGSEARAGAQRHAPHVPAAQRRRLQVGALLQRQLQRGGAGVDEERELMPRVSYRGGTLLASSVPADYSLSLQSRTHPRPNSPTRPRAWGSPAPHLLQPTQRQVPGPANHAMHKQPCTSPGQPPTCVGTGQSCSTPTPARLH